MTGLQTSMQADGAEPCIGALLRDLLPGDAKVPEFAVRGLAMDSRDVQPGDLFLACQGRSGHGLDYLPVALARGAAGVLFEPQADGERTVSTAALPVPALAVPGLRAAAGELAARFYGHPSRRLHVVGVTGTNGKSTVTWLIAGASERLGMGTLLIGTLGAGRPGALRDSPLTTPDPVALQRHLASAIAVDGDLRGVAMEVSSHALDQGRVCGMRFEVGVFTNLSRDHLDYHGDMAAYAQAKARLFLEHLPRLSVINVDDPQGRLLAEAVGKSGRELITTGTGPALHRATGQRHLQMDAIEGAPGEGLAFSVSLDGAPEVRVQLTHLMGQFNASNAAQVIAVLLDRGVALEDACAAVAQCPAPPGRMERLGGAQGQPVVVIDYSHTPDSLEHALTALRPQTRGRLLCVFGCGGDRDPGKRPLMGRVADLLADEVIVTDDNPRTEDPRRIVEGVLRGFARAQRALVVHDRSDAIRQAISMAKADDVVLIAGKGHEAWQVRGRERKRFSDQEQALAALAELHP